MGSQFTAAGNDAHDGCCAVGWEIFREENGLLEYVFDSSILFLGFLWLSVGGKADDGAEDRDGRIQANSSLSVFLNRLGQIYDLEVSRHGRNHKQTRFQSSWSCRGRCYTMSQ